MADSERQLMVACLPLVLKHKGQLRKSFYNRLFKELPEAVDLFAGDTAHQNFMFERSLQDLLYAFTGRGALDSHVANFVSRHQKFQFEERHFAACDSALKGMFTDFAEGQTSFEPRLLDMWLSQVDALVSQLKSGYFQANKAA